MPRDETVVTGNDLHGDAKTGQICKGLSSAFFGAIQKGEEPAENQPDLVFPAIGGPDFDIPPRYRNDANTEFAPGLIPLLKAVTLLRIGSANFQNMIECAFCNQLGAGVGLQ